MALGGLHFALAIPGLSGLVRRIARAEGPEVELLGLRFRNPVGLAAGFDKDARHVQALGALGFGFIEVGSVTAVPATGNAQPRLFRLRSDRALVNRMGLNNAGSEMVAARLAQLEAPVPVFVNVAKTHDPAIVAEAAIADYVTTVEQVAPHADVVVLNVSCPNSGDGRTFEDPAALAPLLDAVGEKLSPDQPWLVKVSPDLDPGQLLEVVDVSLAAGAHGFTATNTTVDREGLRTPGVDTLGPGGLSGEPLHARALATVERIRAHTDAPIIGVGGISTGDHAQAFLDRGASLVQLYTGFVYGGPLTVRRICAGLRRA